MNFNKTKYLILILFLFASYGLSKAQDDCSVHLKQAEKFYEDGAIDSIAPLIEPCMRSGFNQKERIQAYRLFVLINLYKDKHTQADSVMLKLLYYDPEYEANRSIEEPEFLYLFDSFQTSPLWAYGFYMGVNFSNILTTEEYGVNNLNAPSLLKSTSAMSYHFGIKYNRFLMKKAELNIGLQFAQNKYKNTKTEYDFTNISFEETQTRLSLPLTISYDLNSNKIKPFIRAGISFGYLLDSKAKVIRSYTDASHAEIKGTDVELKKFRNPFNIWAIVGGGLKYKVKRGNIFLDLKYNIGVFNQVKADERYNNTELIYKYYYIDNNFKINNLSISLGYMYLFYKPKKIR